MTRTDVEALVSTVRRELASVPPLSPGEDDAVVDAMRAAGLAVELQALRSVTIDPPDLPLFEYYWFGFDTWSPSLDDRLVFVETCRRILRRDQ
jgi:hypothetical protein